MAIEVNQTFSRKTKNILHEHYFIRDGKNLYWAWYQDGEMTAARCRLLPNLSEGAIATLPAEIQNALDKFRG